MIKHISISLLLVTILVGTPCLFAEIVILKDDRVFEGKVTEEDDKIILRTGHGTLKFDKDEIKQIAKDAQELLTPGDKLWEEAKECYERAVEKLRENPLKMNKELSRGITLLYEAHHIYDKVRQMLPQEKYQWIDTKKSEILSMVKMLRLAKVLETRKDRLEREYQIKAAELAETDAKGHYELALWCEKEGLKKRIKEELKKVIKIEPDHAEAREKLGYVKKDDQWVLQDERLEKPSPSSPPAVEKPLAPEEFVEKLRSGTVEEKIEAIARLTELKADIAIPALFDEFLKEEPDEMVYNNIKKVLPEFNHRKVVPRLIKIAKSSPADELQSDVLELLSKIGDRKCAVFLAIKFLNRRIDREERYQLGRLILKCKDRDAAVPKLSKYIRSKDLYLSQDVIDLLVDIGTEKAAEGLVRNLVGSSQSEIEPIMGAIEKIGLPNAILPLIKNLDNVRSKHWVAVVLRRLTLGILRTERTGNWGMWNKKAWLKWWKSYKWKLQRKHLKEKR